jgi:metal-sulfur cluster biosynthetic enzyme
MKGEKAMGETNTSSQTADQMIQALQTVIDPEFGVDLVNLGLIYGIELTTKGTAVVRMTLTTMGCPISAVLQQMVNAALLKVTGVEKVQIEVVWEPAWTPERMSRLAKVALGFHK